MTHRLSLAAFLFGLVATTSIGFAASLHHATDTTPSVRMVQLERVEISAKRLPAAE